MSVISHLLYDEQQSAAYRKEAEGIVSRLSGFTSSEASAKGLSRAYHIAVTETLRRLTLYDLQHETAVSSQLRSGSVKIAVPDERRRLAQAAARNALQQNGWYSVL